MIQRRISMVLGIGLALALILSFSFWRLWTTEKDNYQRIFKAGEALGQEITTLRLENGQLASENALAPYSNKLLISDTDPLLTSVWSNFLYGSCDPQIEEAAMNHDYDLYLLTDVDVPWIKDDVRYLPDDRENFLKLCEQTLIEHNRNYVKLSGAWESRMKTAIDAIEGLF